MITPEQCRAARAWLDLKQEELAQAAEVSLSTVRDFEKGRRTPMANNAKAIVAAFERAGLRMVADAQGRPLGIERLID